MQWSSYNTLFKSNRFGYFLYNALSNALFELDAKHYKKLKNLRENAYLHPFNSNDDEFLTLLHKQHVVLKAGEDERILLEKENRRNALSNDASELGLTICPTLNCNFNCPYCFEDHQKHNCGMQIKTIKQLLLFVEKFKNAKKLSIVWYGGEPTLNFKAICDISEGLEKLRINFDNASLTTNGYLLTPDKANLFNDLRIQSVQITLDGPQEVHDRRRKLSSGQPTFSRILENIHTLFESSYAGNCVIRVNIDKTNIGSFRRQRKQLLKEFKGKRLKVYPGKVEIVTNLSYDHSCMLSVQEWSDFILDLYRKNGIMPVYGLFPNLPGEGLCVANRENNFIIGPEGELYKCWENVGDQKMVVGSIFKENYITRPDIIAMYRVGTDPYRDPTCLACKTLPICGGGCANRRLNKKYFNENSLDFCSPLKNNLVAWLEEYYDSYLTANLCKKILQSGKIKTEQKGYKMIQPNQIIEDIE